MATGDAMKTAYSNVASQKRKKLPSPTISANTNPVGAAIGAAAGMTTPKFPTMNTNAKMGGVGAGPLGAAMTAARNFQAQPSPVQQAATGMNATLGKLTTAVNTPFQYDPNNDQAFQAYAAQARKNLALNQANTNAHLRASGQGRSSYSEAVQQQMANSGAQDLQNAMIQQYLPQAYRQYQDNLSNLQGLYNTQYQDEVTRPLAIAQQTGTFQDPAMMKMYDAVLQAKQNYAAAKTPAERAAANAAANAARQQIAAMGGNADLVGANVTADQAAANRGQFGVRTLAGQASDLQNRQANLGAAIDVSNLTGRVVNPANDWSLLYKRGQDPNAPLTAAQQNVQYNQQQDQINNLWKVADATGTIPDQLADMYGIPRGTETQAAKQWAQQFGLQQDQNDLNWVEADQRAAEAAAKGATDAYKGLTPNQVFDAISKQYTENYIDPNTGDTKTRMTTDPDQRYNMFLNVIDSGLPDAQTDQLLTLLGLSKDEIAKFTKQAGGK